MLSLESTSNRMHRLAKALLYQEPVLTADEIIARIENVTREEVQNLACGMFGQGQPALAAIGAVTEQGLGASFLAANS